MQHETAQYDGSRPRVKRVLEVKAYRRGGRSKVMRMPCTSISMPPTRLQAQRRRAAVARAPPQTARGTERTTTLRPPDVIALVVP